MTLSDFFKFRDIKTYGNVEVLADNNKKYRSVFDQQEAAYIYCEFSFYNKKFDTEDWDLKMQLKCLDEKNEVICDFDCDRTIDKNNPVIYVREGWGTKTPNNFWAVGTYRWEAHIDNELVASQPFYIESCGLVKVAYNPYFKVENLRLYEGPEENLEYTERKYRRQFKVADTRYIWIELQAKSLHPKNSPWPCEIFYNIITSSGHLKGHGKYLYHVDPKQDNFAITLGWGSNILGTWACDNYLVELVFMDVIIAQTSFVVENNNASPSFFSRLKYLFLGKD